MSEEVRITLHLNDALYNAGILGFLRVLEKGKISYELSDQIISFSSDEMIDKFTNAYFDTLLAMYGSETGAYRFCEARANLSRSRNAEAEKRNQMIEDVLKLMGERMGKASYQAACGIIKKHGEEFDFIECAKAIKTATDQETKLTLLFAFYEKFKCYLRVFQLKDIAYGCVQLYWSNLAFLHKQKNMEEFETSFEDEFIQPIKTYKPRKTANPLTCFQCGRVLPSGIASMAWINGLGVDVKRKANDFYHFEVDISPCPYCRLVYACLPIGFYTYAREGIFVNNNHTITSLRRANAFDPEDLRSDSKFYRMISSFILNAELKEAKEKLANIQVLRRTESGYRVNILSPQLLEAMYRAKRYFERLQETNSIVVRDVLKHVLDGQKLYAYIIRSAKNALSKGYPLGIYYIVLEIQTKMSHKEDCRMSYISEAKNAGFAMRCRIQSSVNEKKIAGMTYHLLNALQTGNVNRYINILARQCASLNMDIPPVFLEMLKDEEHFLEIGNAFMIGLNLGVEKEKGNDKQERQAKEELE